MILTKANFAILWSGIHNGEIGGMCGRWNNGGSEYTQHFRDLAEKGGRRLVAEDQPEEDSSF